MATREQTMESRGYAMADAPKPGGLYRPVILHDGVAYLSGMVPFRDGEVAYTGKVPSAVGVEDAKEAAELSAANLLRVFAREVGPLDRITQVLKVTGFVNADPDLTDAHLVMNGASQLIIDVLGDAGQHARYAVGVATLPLGASVEVEMIVAVSK